MDEKKEQQGKESRSRNSSYEDKGLDYFEKTDVLSAPWHFREVQKKCPGTIVIYKIGSKEYINLSCNRH